VTEVDNVNSKDENMSTTKGKTKGLLFDNDAVFCISKCGENDVRKMQKNITT